MESIIPDRMWHRLAPLIEEYRPKGKRSPRKLRRTLSAIFWRHQNGTKWRAIPAELGPWWLAAQLFSRWSKQGVWQKLFRHLSDADPALGMVCFDGTVIRAHQKAAGAAKKGEQRAIKNMSGSWPLTWWFRIKSLRSV